MCYYDFEESMKDYIFEIQCYEKSNLLKDFAESCGYHLGLYHFYNDHAVVDFLSDEEMEKIIQQPICMEIYAFTIKPAITNKSHKNIQLCKEFRAKWREFMSKKFPEYDQDMEDFYHGNTTSL